MQDEINQVLTTMLWLEMRWFDNKLTWQPEKFDNIKKIHIPSEQMYVSNAC